MKKSYRASSAERNNKDHYPTPWSLVFQLLERENFPSSVLEPCVGENRTIEKYLLSKGYGVIGYDLWFGAEEERRDFLCETRSFPAIITNPPFRLADQFVETAFRVADKFAFLMPLDYIHGQSRYRKFYCREYRPRRIYTFTRRPLFDGLLRSDGKYRTGSTTFSWFVFEGKYSGLPEIDWIDNQRFILTASDRQTGLEWAEETA